MNNSRAGWVLEVTRTDGRFCNHAYLHGGDSACKYRLLHTSQTQLDAIYGFYVQNWSIHNAPTIAEVQ